MSADNPSSWSVRDGNGYPKSSNNTVDSAGNLTPQHAIRTNGAPVEVGNPLPTQDANGAAFGGVVQITLGTAFPAGRSIAFVCTVSGDVDLVFQDGSTWTGYPLQASPGAVQTLPYALSKMSLSAGSTAVVTAWILK